jgi:hypothetical protein
MGEQNFDADGGTVPHGGTKLPVPEHSWHLGRVIPIADAEDPANPQSGHPQRFVNPGFHTGVLFGWYGRAELRRGWGHRPASRDETPSPRTLVAPRPRHRDCRRRGPRKSSKRSPAAICEPRIPYRRAIRLVWASRTATRMGAPSRMAGRNSQFPSTGGTSAASSRLPTPRDPQILKAVTRSDL